MGFEDLEAKVKAEADKQVREVKAKAKSEMNEIKRELDLGYEKKKAKLNVDYDKKKVSLSSSIVSNARLEVSNKISLEKSRILDSIYMKAREKILSLSDKEKKKLLAKFLEDSSLIDGEVTVLVDKKYSSLLPKKKGIKVKSEAIGDFGLVLTNSDNSVRVDKRLTPLLRDLSSELNPHLSSILFVK